MKKLHLFLILSVFLLCACSSKQQLPEVCAHQWVEANCENPRTCTLCRLTEGTALGHQWTEADCARAKTCSRCAATEGEPLDHIWMDATCTAPKTCQVCAVTEGALLPHRYDDWLKDPVEDWMFRNCLDCGQATDPVPYDPEQYLVDYASGIWALMLPGEMQVLTLNRDMTFDLNNETQGSWSYQVSEEVDNGLREWKMKITLHQGGSIVGHTVRFLVGSGPDSVVFQMEQILNQHYNTEYSLEMDGRFYSDITKLGVEAARESLKSPEEKVLGTWTSLFTEQAKPEYVAQVTDDYFITFREDGTFHAKLAEEYTGTWQFRKISAAFGEMTYSYALQLDKEEDEDKEKNKYSLKSAGITSEGYLSLDEQGSNYNKLYIFSQTGPMMPEDKMEAAAGQWNAVASRTDKYWTGKGWAQVGEMEIRLGNQITFHPDGTLEANWDGEKTGRWFYFVTTTNAEDPGIEYMHYWVQFADQDRAWELIVTKELYGSELPLQISSIADDQVQTDWFIRSTTQEAEFFCAAGETILGTWKIGSGPHYPSDVDISEFEALLLTFEENGVLRVSNGTNSKGTWKQQLTYIPGLGAGFSLECRSAGTYSYIYCFLTDENTMQINVIREGESFQLMLERETET